MKMSRHKAYVANPDFTPTSSNSTIPTSMNPVYEGVSTRAEAEQHCLIYEGTQTPEKENVYDANMGSSQDSSLTENPAYGEVPTRVEDDKEYYTNEGMGGAEVRMTKNGAYGTCRQ